MAGIKVSVICGDAFKEKADTLILKYAQASNGLDEAVVNEFERLGESIFDKLPLVGSYFFTASDKVTETKNIIFIGVPILWKFGYKEIREFGKKALETLAIADPLAEKVLMTIHGAGYGLDEIEAFKSQLAGIVDSISIDNIPDNLSEILFVEQSEGRSARLQKTLKTLFPSFEIPTKKNGSIKQPKESTVEVLSTVGYSSNNKKSVFVAMPFASEFSDRFDYGIQGAVNQIGYLCERADQQSFTGDVMTFVKERIALADIVIADLTGANPNVYLEVGYAWGLNKKTILLVEDTKQLLFDTRGQRCLEYKTIKDLETKLKNELSNLKL